MGQACLSLQMIIFFPFGMQGYLEFPLVAWPPPWMTCIAAALLIHDDVIVSMLSAHLKLMYPSPNETHKLSADIIKMLAV